MRPVLDCIWGVLNGSWGGAGLRRHKTRLLRLSLLLTMLTHSNAPSMRAGPKLSFSMLRLRSLFGTIRNRSDLAESTGFCAAHGDAVACVSIQRLMASVNFSLGHLKGQLATSFQTQIRCS